MELQLKYLSKQYAPKCAVDNVSADLMPGVYGLFGANGAGKFYSSMGLILRCLQRSERISLWADTSQLAAGSFIILAKTGRGVQFCIPSNTLNNRLNSHTWAI